MYWIIQFSAFQLLRFEGDWTSSLQGRTECEHCAGAVVTSVTRDENLVVAQVLVINYRQTFSTNNELFNCVKSLRMVSGPRKEVRFIAGVDKSKVNSDSVMRISSL